MLKGMINRILDLGEIRTCEIDGQVYAKDNIAPIFPVNFISPDPLCMFTLTGLRDYLLEVGEHGGDGKLIVHVAGHNNVNLVGELIEAAGNRRHHFVSVKLMDEPFAFDRFMDLEMFVISLQSQFVQTDELSAIIDMLGSVANEHVTTAKDSGFTQSLQIRTGITTRERAQIKNPVRLAPFRTFREVDQPESEFILRFRNDSAGLSAALFEADGARWKLDAILSIKKFFEAALKEIGASDLVSILG